MTNALFMSPRLNYSTDQDEWTNIFSQIFSCFQWSDLKNSKKLRDCSFFMKCENSHFFKIMKIDTAAFHRGRTKWSPKELRKPTTWPNSWAICEILKNFLLHTGCTQIFFRGCLHRCMQNHRYCMYSGSRHQHIPGLLLISLEWHLKLFNPLFWTQFWRI